MKIIELRTEEGRSIAHAGMAWSFKTRCVGLIRRRTLAAEEGLLLVPGGSVHTLGMSFPIDVVFLDRALKVIGLRKQVAPWRFVLAPAQTRFALELRAGRIEQSGLALNSTLCACFEDEEGEEAGVTAVPRQARARLPARRSTQLDIVVRPRPVSPCFAFSLRLPLQRRSRPVRRHHMSGRAPLSTPPGSSDETA